MEVGIKVVRRRWVERSWRTLWRAREREDAVSVTAPVLGDVVGAWLKLDARLCVTDLEEECGFLLDWFSLSQETEPGTISVSA